MDSRPHIGGRQRAGAKSTRLILRWHTSASAEYRQVHRHHCEGWKDARFATGERTFAAGFNAVEAVKQYVYKPTLPNGQPVEVITLVEVRRSDARPAFENARM